MALKIRLARHGRKAKPFYRIVVADSRMPRDGRYIERVGTYNPLLANDDENRVVLVKERIEYWMGEGAKPSERVAIFLGKAGIIDMPTQPVRPKKSSPKQKALDLLEEKKEKAEAAKEAAKAAKEEAKAAKAAEAEAPKEEEAPAEEAKAEEAATDAPKEDAKEEATDAPAEEKTEEAAPEAPAEEAKAEEAAPEAEAPETEEKKED